jgi:HK97 family phage major capsid protein
MLQDLARSRVDQALQAIATYGPLASPQPRRPAENFSLARTLRGMASESLPGYERSVLEGAALAASESFDAQRIRVPWHLLARDLAVGTGSAGGYLAGTDVLQPRDVLRGFSVVADAGVTIVGGLKGATNIPKITTPPTTSILANEQTQITESTAAPVFGVSTFAPKNVACYVEISRQLLVQSPVAEATVRTALLGAVGQLLDKQILQGAGTAGEIMGLFNVSGVQTQPGTSLTWAAVNTMTKLCTEAGARDAEVAFISTPAVRATLQGRIADTVGVRFIWSGDDVAGRRAYASNDCASGSMIVGPWPQVVVGVWGDGVTIELNPYAQFQSGVVGARVILSCDAAPIFPGAFVKSTSIT